MIGATRISNCPGPGIYSGTKEKSHGSQESVQEIKKVKEAPTDQVPHRYALPQEKRGHGRNCRLVGWGLTFIGDGLGQEFQPPDC